MRTLIAIPAMDMIHTVFFKSVVQMDKVGDVRFALTSSSLVYAARNDLAKKAITEGFDRVLWFDSDMEFAPDVMKRLSADLDEGRDFVTGLYFKRRAPIEPCVYKEVGYYHKPETNEVTPVALAYEDYPRDQIFEIGGCGFGCVMMNTSLLIKVVSEVGAPFSPRLGFGEDLTFCKHVESLGVKMYCDSRIKCGHVGQGTITEETYFQTRGVSNVDA